MRILIIVIVLLSVGLAAYAKDVFVDKALKHIQVVEVTEEGVTFQSTDGTVEEVFIGDTTGSEAAEVVERGFGLNLRLLSMILGDMVCKWKYYVVFFHIIL